MEALNCFVILFARIENVSGHVPSKIIVFSISLSVNTFDNFDPSFLTRLYMQEYSFGSKPLLFMSWGLNVMEIYPFSVTELEDYVVVDLLKISERGIGY